MEKSEFNTIAEKLYNWVHGQAGRVFFINGYLGHKVSANGGKIILTEADNGGDYPGEEITLEADDVELMEFSEDEYQLSIVTKDDSEHNGQGYDIQAYDLTRIEF